MNDPRTNFTLVRCCRNCYFFKRSVPTSANGLCKLPTITDPKAKPLSSHIMLVCDAHTWIKSRALVQKPALTHKAKLPDDAI